MKTLTMLAAAIALGLPAGTAVAKGPDHCPPGLAKKSPACVPPGLAKKRAGHDGDHDGDYHHDWDQDDYRVLSKGDVVILNGHEYVVVDTRDGTILRRNDHLYRLPVFGDGSEVVRVGDAILRVDRKTKAVIELIELADLILN